MVSSEAWSPLRGRSLLYDFFTVGPTVPPRVYCSAMDSGRSDDGVLGLDYESVPMAPPSKPSQWKYYLIGPFAGAGVGVIKTVTAAWSWEYFGRPAFYFRGW